MKQRNRPCPRMLTYRPPRIAMFLLALAGGLQIALPSVWPALPALPATGFVTGLLGLGVMLRGWWLFRRNDTAICPTAAATRLITSDIYRLTRNPMYLGIVLMLLGVAIATGSLPCHVATLAFFLVIDFVFCPFEEARLDELFGADYVRYRRAVRRWL